MYEPFYDLDKEPSRRLAYLVCSQKARDGVTTENVEGLGINLKENCRGRAVLGALVLAGVACPILALYFWGIAGMLSFLLIDFVCVLIGIWLTGRATQASD